MTVSAYTPKDAPFYVRPVQVETPIGLTGVDTAGGKGVLCWLNGDSIRFAVLPSFRDFGRDDVVEAGDIGEVTAYPGVFEHVRPTISRVGGELMVVTSRNTGFPGVGVTEVWVANDSETPTAWSFRGYIQNYGGLAFNTPSTSATSTGKIRRLPSGRLIYMGGLWHTAFGPNSNHSGVWYSDNSGATWTNVLDEGYGFVGGNSLNIHSAALGFDPISGLFYWSGQGASAGIVETSPDGVNWTKEITGTQTPRIFPIEDNGSRGFFGDQNGVIHRVEDLSIANLDYAGMPDTGYRWLPPGQALTEGSVGCSTRFLVHSSGAAFAFYNDEKVAVFPTRGWQMGSVAL